MIKDKFQKALKHLIFVFDKDLSQPLQTLKDKVIEEKQRWYNFFLKQSNYSNDRRESNLNNRNTIKVYQNEIKKGTKPRARTKKTKKETEDIIKEFAGLQINEPNAEDDLQELKLNLMIIVRTQFRNQEYTYDLIKQFIDTKAQKNIVILQEIKEWLLAQDIASNKQIDSWMLDVMLDLKVDLIITKTNLESFDRIKGLVKNCYQKVKDNQDDVILLSKKTQINNFVGQDEDLVFYPKNYQSFLMQINGMSEKKAIAVCKRFKTLRLLAEHLRSLPQFDWSSIANIEVKQLDNKKHVIGEKLARTLYMLLSSENHMQYIYQN